VRGEIVELHPSACCRSGSSQAWTPLDRHVILIYVRKEDEVGSLHAVRQKLVEAEAEYRRARTDAYVTRQIRDSAMVEAHRAGMSSREIGELLGGIDQPNVVRARRRATTRRELIPDGYLSPVDALRTSKLGPRAFIEAVREGRIRTVEIYPGVHAFRPEDIRGLTAATNG
jgi:hypothetical protein